jgi:hypothetical protein
MKPTSPESGEFSAGQQLLLELVAAAARESPYSFPTLVDFQIKTIRAIADLLRTEAHSWGAADGDAVEWIGFAATFVQQLISTPTEFLTCSRCQSPTRAEGLRGKVCLFCAETLEGTLE